MPNCQSCHCLEAGSCKALQQATLEFGRPVNPIGACIVPIVNQYCSLLQADMKILEIGCGTWSPLIKAAQAAGAHYEGIDSHANYYGKPSVATRIENLADLSYPDNSFDYVVGNQCMEHWGEFGCSLNWGLYQAFRVCKPEGWVMMNVPIHFHGTKEFVHGDLERLRKLFELFSSKVEFVSWRKHSAPLPEFHPHPYFWALKDNPAYILDIRAQRNKPLPVVRPNQTFGGIRLQRWRNYSFSFLVYRALQKLKILPSTLENQERFVHQSRAMTR
jgi:SAM-dependent methyltransferase